MLEMEMEMSLGEFVDDGMGWDGMGWDGMGCSCQCQGQCESVGVTPLVSDSMIELVSRGTVASLSSLSIHHASNGVRNHEIMAHTMTY